MEKGHFCPFSSQIKKEVSKISVFKAPPKGKEWLYVGHYVDVNGNFILKVGTTNDLERRQKEHNRNYKRAEKYTMPKNGSFVYDWFTPLSKYNTIRFEDKTRADWQAVGIGEYIRNDRFCCGQKPQKVNVTIRKTYEICL